MPPTAISRVFFGIAFIAAAAAVSYAQTCKVTCPDGNSMTVSCDTKVDPCPLQDLGAPPALGSPEWRAVFDRFHDVVDRLRAHEPTLMERQPAPVTYQDLVRQSGVLFEESAFLLDTINLRNRWFTDRIKRQENELRALVNREKELRIRINAIPGERSETATELARTRREAEVRRVSALSIQRAASAMQERAKRAAKDLIYWLAIAEPPGVAPIREGILNSRVASRQEPLVWTQQRPESAILITPSAPSFEEFSGVPIRRAQPQGSALDRLAAAEGLIPQLTDAIEILRRNETTQARNETVLAPARSRIAVLLTTVMQAQGALNNLRAQTLSFGNTRAAEVQTNQVRALGNLRRAAAETYVLELYRDRVLIPEVRAFLNANRVTRTLDHASVVRFYEARTRLLEARNHGPYVGVQRLIALQQRTARVLGDYRVYAGDAAGMIAGDGAFQARSIQAEIKRNLGAGTNFPVSAPDRETGALAKIARALLAP